MAESVPTSIYLTPHDQEILERLKERHNLTRSAVIRLALERLYASDAERKTRLVEIAEEIRQIA